MSRAADVVSSSRGFRDGLVFQFLNYHPFLLTRLDQPLSYYMYSMKMIYVKWVKKQKKQKNTKKQED